jgi:hypothetical protein
MSAILLFKLLTMPLVITTATLAGRRFGPAVAGLILGLPIVSGPISVFIAVEQGVEFAQHAVTGTLLGLIALAAYALVYGHAAQRLNWLGALACGLAATVMSVTLLKTIVIPEPAVIWITTAAIALAIWLCPRPGRPIVRPPAPAWDLPARIAVATAFMLSVTVVAAAIGPAMTGMASTFPVMLSVMAPFTHRVEGRSAVVAMMRGCAEGLVTFVLFFQVLGLLLGKVPLLAAYLIALAASLALAAVVLNLQRRRAARIG